MTEPTTDDVENLPPSAKYIVYVLEDQGPLTYSEIVEVTLLPGRTVDEAIDRLRESNIVRSQYLADDARARRYHLK